MLNYLYSLMPAMLKGLFVTLKIFTISLVLSLPLGLILGLGRMSRRKILSSLIGVYIWVLRGSPLMLQIVFIFFGLPLININLDRMPAVLLALSLNYAAYFAEIFRSGFQSIGQGQYQAAKSLGFNRLQSLFYIILPQVIKRVLPSIANEVISLIKDSSLVYVVGLGELLRAGKIAANRDVSLLPLVLVAIIYLGLTALAGRVFKALEASYSYKE